ncbi:MAG: lipid-A-disaccharide synthase [Janthinobacterium lividum]
MRVTLVAGEASGDLLGAALMGGLATRLPDGTRFDGIGGPRMQARGFDSRWRFEALSVNGYVEVLAHLPEILRIRRQLQRALADDPPDALVGIDAPDFNFAVERRARAAGVPTVHFVSPSIWAWRGGRITGIARSVDHMLCLFPFEPAIYERAGVPASFVGHPLADSIPMVPNPQAARRALKLAENGPLLAVMPGSRRSEIRLIGPLFFETMRLLQGREPSLRFVLPAASQAARELLAPLLAEYADLSLTVVDSASHMAIEAADAVLTKSGTSTLEAALYKKPMVISYKVPALTAQIMKRQGYLPYVGLPNILAGRFVVPELLQHFATPRALADATLAQLNDDANRGSLVDLFSGMHRTLQQGTAERAAEVIAGLLDATGRPFVRKHS